MNGRGGVKSARFDAPEHNPLLNALVYAGIGAKLAVSLAITAAKRR